MSMSMTSDLLRRPPPRIRAFSPMTSSPAKLPGALPQQPPIRWALPSEFLSGDRRPIRRHPLRRAPLGWLLMTTTAASRSARGPSAPRVSKKFWISKNYPQSTDQITRSAWADALQVSKLPVAHQPCATGK
jgi:hypothetical protein